MFESFYEEIVNLDNAEEQEEIQQFLLDQGLLFESPDYCVRILNDQKQLVGTGSLAGNIIKGVAVHIDYRESVVFSKIITHLLERLSERKVETCFVFTKPDSAQSFVHLGFQFLATADPLISVLERGANGIDAYQDYLKQHCFSDQSGEYGVVIVNCNPFTLGHRYLIESASKKVDGLYVIVVEEDRSSFPFYIRYELVKKGVADLSNVRVLRGSNYVVSSATFPSYFLKNESESDIALKQAELDVRIFATHIAPVLGATQRFVGTEDYCVTTAGYNQAMRAVLPEYGIDLNVITRKRLPDDLIISASHVRKALKEDDWSLVQKLVPQTTFDFLKSDQAKSIIDSLRQSDKRH